MAKASIAANLAKMLQVQAGLSAGLSLNKASKAARTSAGTYQKWSERYAALQTPIAVVPASERCAYAFGGDFLFVVDEDPAGLLLRRIETDTGTIQECRIEGARSHYDYRQMIAVAAAADGSLVRFLHSMGELWSWAPETDTTQLEDFDVSVLGNRLGYLAGSGTRQWTSAHITPDLDSVVFWGGADDPPTLSVATITDSTVRAVYKTNARDSLPFTTLHPHRPLLATLRENKLVTVLNYETGAVLMEDGPQVHSASFGPGDTLLCDDWYSKTIVVDYVQNTRTRLRPGWGSQASQSTRFLNAAPQHLHLRDTIDPTVNRSLTLDEIVTCRLSSGGRFVAVQTDHITVWSVDQLLAS